MMFIDVKIKVLKGGKTPIYQHEEDACADCFARFSGEIVILPKQSVLIPLGFCLELPVGYRGMIYPRSGLASKKRVVAVTGVIDSNYRGELCCSLINDSEEPFVINNGDRICQLAIEPAYKANFLHYEVLNDSERGKDGFGSTGV